MSDIERKEAATAALGLAGKTARAFIHSPLSPLLFLAMLFPLLFIGGGKLSLDYLVAKKLK